MKKLLSFLFDIFCWCLAFLLALLFWGSILGQFNKVKADELYLKIGSGYKLIETNNVLMDSGERIYYETGGKISARIEFGKERGNWTYGVSHHSQWFSGFPFNDRTETHVTELFVDYKWEL